MYWIPLYELLESRGVTLLLVNARHVKNVSGRKSDVLDCQWLQQLMSFGLSHGAFRPGDQVCVLRSHTRQRALLPMSDRIQGAGKLYVVRIHYPSVATISIFGAIDCTTF